MKADTNWTKSQVVEVRENEIEHSYKIHYDTKLKELKILWSLRLEVEERVQNQ